MTPKVAIGITTFNRPAYLQKCLTAVREHLAPLCEAVVVHNDGSDRKYHGEYARSYKRLQTAVIQDSAANEGVSKSKNALLRYMLDDTDAEWLFLLEDDILPLSSQAVTNYYGAIRNSDFHHLSFAHHGPANLAGPVMIDGPISYFEHSIGAWCMYSRECLETVGLFDENLHNAWEHVELTLRLAHAGFTSGAYHFADATGSEKWLKEIPGSIEHSSIRPLATWRSSIRDGMIYWHDEKPDTWNMLFGEKQRLHAYALSVMA